MLWSPTCLNCRRQASRALCQACWRQVLPTHHPLDIIQTDLGAFQHYAYSDYQGLVKTLLYQLKYSQRKGLGKALGTYLGEWILTQDSIKYDWLIPVPLHEQRHQERGYNQAELLARGISQLSGKPLRQILIRKTQTPPLYDQSPSERAETLKDAFGFKKKLPTRIQAVLLVDDIFTTGSTLKEVTQLLWQNYPDLNIQTLSLARA